MFIKAFLCLMIILSGIGAGQMKAKSYDNRVNHLQDCITTLKILESEMKYRLDPIPELFPRICEMKQGMMVMLLETACRNLKQPGSKDFTYCWTEAVNEVYQESSFTKEDIQILCDFGIDLGKTDMESQNSLFSRTFSLLENQVKEAVEIKLSKGKMYKSLGASVGVLIVILLI